MGPMERPRYPIRPARGRNVSGPYPQKPDSGVNTGERFRGMRPGGFIAPPDTAIGKFEANTAIRSLTRGPQQCRRALKVSWGAQIPVASCAA
jgi:hypothetical protein